MTAPATETRPRGQGLDVAWLAAWTECPLAGGRDAAAAREAVAPIVLRWSVAARPTTVRAADLLLTAAAGFAAFARRTMCAVDFDAALVPEMVRRYMVVAAAGPGVRRALEAIGRAVNPEAWPPEERDDAEGEDGEGPEDDRDTHEGETVECSECVEGR